MRLPDIAPSAELELGVPLLGGKRELDRNVQIAVSVSLKVLRLRRENDLCIDQRVADHADRDCSRFIAQTRSHNGQHAPGRARSASKERVPK